MSTNYLQAPPTSDGTVLSTTTPLVFGKENCFPYIKLFATDWSGLKEEEVEALGGHLMQMNRFVTKHTQGLSKEHWSPECIKTVNKFWYDSNQWMYNVPEEYRKILDRRYENYGQYIGNWEKINFTTPEERVAWENINNAGFLDPDVNFSALPPWEDNSLEAVLDRGELQIQSDRTQNNSITGSFYHGFGDNKRFDSMLIASANKPELTEFVRQISFHFKHHTDKWNKEGHKFDPNNLPYYSSFAHQMSSASGGAEKISHNLLGDFEWDGVETEDFVESEGLLNVAFEPKKVFRNTSTTGDYKDYRIVWHSQGIPDSNNAPTWVIATDKVESKTHTLAGDMVVEFLSGTHNINARNLGYPSDAISSIKVTQNGITHTYSYTQGPRRLDKDGNLPTKGFQTDEYFFASSVYDQGNLTEVVYDNNKAPSNNYQGNYLYTIWREERLQIIHKDGVFQGIVISYLKDMETTSIQFNNKTNPDPLDPNNQTWYKESYTFDNNSLISRGDKYILTSDYTTKTQHTVIDDFSGGVDNLTNGSSKHPPSVFTYQATRTPAYFYNQKELYDPSWSICAELPDVLETKEYCLIDTYDYHTEAGGSHTWRGIKISYYHDTVTSGNCNFSVQTTDVSGGTATRPAFTQEIKHQIDFSNTTAQGVSMKRFIACVKCDGANSQVDLVYNRGSETITGTLDFNKTDQLKGIVVGMPTDTSLNYLQGGWEGKIAELFNSAATSGEDIDSIVGYLSHKNGIELPDTHPYYDSCPSGCKIICDPCMYIDEETCISIPDVNPTIRYSVDQPFFNQINKSGDFGFGVTSIPYSSREDEIYDGVAGERIEQNDDRVVRDKPYTGEKTVEIKNLTLDGRPCDITHILSLSGMIYRSDEDCPTGSPTFSAKKAVCCEVDDVGTTKLMDFNQDFDQTPGDFMTDEEKTKLEERCKALGKSEQYDHIVNGGISVLSTGEVPINATYNPATKRVIHYISSHNPAYHNPERYDFDKEAMNEQFDWHTEANFGECLGEACCPTTTTTTTRPPIHPVECFVDPKKDANCRPYLQVKVKMTAQGLASVGLASDGWARGLAIYANTTGDCELDPDPSPSGNNVEESFTKSTSTEEELEQGSSNSVISGGMVSNSRTFTVAASCGCNTRWVVKSLGLNPDGANQQQILSGNVICGGDYFVSEEECDALECETTTTTSTTTPIYGA